MLALVELGPPDRDGGSIRGQLQQRDVIGIERRFRMSNRISFD